MKESTAEVYGRFDGAAGFAERRARVLAIAAARPAPRDLADAAAERPRRRSPLAADLLAAGAFRADVSGAGPTVYGLFADRPAAERAAAALGPLGRIWVADPAW